MFRLLLWQLGALLLVAVSLLMVGHLQAVSFLVGGLIQMGPNWWFTRQAFRYSGARRAEQVVSGFYSGETGKFLFTGLLFASLFVLSPSVDIIALFAGFVSMLVLHSLIIGCYLGRPAKPE